MEDKGTGKSQSIVIQSSGGLAKNEIDSLIYSTEKTLTDNADKVSDEIKKEVETAIAAAKEVKDSDDLDTLKSKTEELNKAAMKVGQAIYGQQQQQEGDAAASDAEDSKDSKSEEKKDDTVDADFKEKEEKK